jgi:hypothetical protein
MSSELSEREDKKLLRQLDLTTEGTLKGEREVGASKQEAQMIGGGILIAERVESRSFYQQA